MPYVITLENGNKKWYWYKSGGWLEEFGWPALYESEPLATFDCMQINVMRGSEHAHATVEQTDIALIWKI